MGIESRDLEDRDGGVGSASQTVARAGEYGDSRKGGVRELSVWKHRDDEGLDAGRTERGQSGARYISWLP